MHRGRRQHARWPVDHRAARRALITHAPPTSSRFAVGLRATRRPLSRRAGTMQAPDASSPSCARAISPRQGAARLVQDWIVIPLTPAKHQATCRLPCPLCAFRRDACQPYISGRHGRAPDYSPGRRAAAPAPCTRAIICDLKPIVDRRAARVAAWTPAAAAPNWKVIPDWCKKTSFMHSTKAWEKCRLVFVARQQWMPDTGGRICSTANPGCTICASPFFPFDLSHGYRQIAG
jgi:hypothetical protein